MDTVQIECNRLTNYLKTKYKLNPIQSEALEMAIAHYDYLQNDGTIFTNTMDILKCFLNSIKTPIAPNKATIYALCEYIIETIKFYDLPTMKIKSQADIKAMEIIKGGEL